MKKTLKIFGLALLATSLMFTACKKDDEEENNNEEQQQEETTPTLSITFDGTTTTEFNYLKALYSTDVDTLYTRTRAAANWADDGNVTLPYLDAFVVRDTMWKVTNVEFGNNGNEMNELTDYFEEFTGNWWFYRLQNGSTIDDADFSNGNLSYNFNLSVISAYERYIEDKDKEDCTVKDLNIKATKLKFVRATASK
ncbi:MAG: hypothetical protein IJ620_02560 [Bacteroidales bacterium]|nr:hypothetical protein [Bacteroidales bacterium]